jgi:hypothetical protein
MLNEAEKFKEELKKDPEGFIDRLLEDKRGWIEESKNLRSNIQKDKKDEAEMFLEDWQIEYFPRWDVEVTALLPAQLAWLNEFSAGKQQNVIVSDIVLVYRKTSIVDRKLSISPPEIEVIRNAILIQEEAAYKLMEEAWWSP